MGYKIVASDLDGTLLGSDAAVSRENMLAIHALTKRGVCFVPSTGRTLSELPSELKNNPDVRYVIHSNGAVVLDQSSGARITRCISRADVRYVLDTLAAYDSHITIRQNGECFVDAEMNAAAHWDHYNVCEPHRRVVTDYAVYLPDFLNFCYAADEIEVFSAFFHSDDEKRACREKLAQNGNLRIVEGHEHNIEIMSADAGKGNALRALAELLGVSIEDTIAIGDSDNDSSILQAAGLALAVRNATEPLRSLADRVICSNEEHVIDYVLAHWFDRSAVNSV